MRLLAAASAGYALGALPTANLIAGAVGIDLRRQGSGNPGANNALRLGGPGLGATVLLVEMAKGAGAALLGGLIAGPGGLAAAGVAAGAGNMYNVLYRMRGGKGLGIGAGVVAVAWPVAFVPLLLVIVLALWVTRSTDWATLITMGVVVLGSAAWYLSGDLPNLWGLDDPALVLAVGIGLAVLIAIKHTRSIMSRA